MKHTFSIALLGALLISFASCQKIKQNIEQEISITHQTHEAQIGSSETYSFNLPTNDFRIKQDANNASLSAISNNNGSVYEYTPEENFEGVETIILTNVDESEKECNKDRKCGNDNDSEEEKTYQEITLQVNVTALEK